MSDTNTITRGPGRPARQQETQERRRRREGLGADRNLKLHVPENFKDRNFEYRWVNDRPGRVQQMTVQDDWETVSTQDAMLLQEQVSEGTVVSRVADRYQGERTVLLRKPKHYYEQDKAEEQKLLDERDKTMRNGALADPQGLTGSEAYTPGGRNIVNGR